MGRLIDIDVLFDYFGNDAIDETTRGNIEYFVSEKGTVDAIPKADYENRLKADLVAMLTELQLEIEEIKPLEPTDNEDWQHGCFHGLELMQDKCLRLIQEKIDSLKENKI